MKAYKGFDKNMTCRGFQFKEGETYEEKSAELCKSGFHACEAPIDVFKYYTPSKSVYHEVELDGVSEERSDDSKVVGKKIKIGAKLNVSNLVSAQFEYVKEHCTNENNANEGEAASAGEFGAASAGEFGAASAGEFGAASAGGRGAASAGGRGAASAGEFGAASAGECGAASAGECGAATSRGASSVGEDGIACARGNGIKVRGGMGAILVIAIENERDHHIMEWNAGVVDGENLKPDTWYTLVNGEFLEAE